jgi:hypothetical protein
VKCNQFNIEINEYLFAWVDQHWPSSSGSLALWGNISNKIYSHVTMVYKYNYYKSGHYLTSCILFEKHDVSEAGFCFRSVTCFTCLLCLCPCTRIFPLKWKLDVHTTELCQFCDIINILISFTVCYGFHSASHRKTCSSLRIKTVKKETSIPYYEYRLLLQFLKILIY